MRHEESSTETPDGLTLYQQSWRGSTTKAAVVLVHGYAEHSGRYEHVAERFTQAGYAIHTFDLRGHGRSEGEPRVYVHSIDEHTGDVERFVAAIREREAGLPLFLLGHSMGGAISARFLADGQRDLRGVILSAPAVLRAGILGRPVEALFLFFARMAPRLHFPKLDNVKISRDPETVRRYDNDPLIYREGMPWGTAAAIVLSARYLDQHASQIELPIFIGHGTDDALVNSLASERLHERVGSKDKKLKLYEGLYHEILNEPERGQVMQDMLDWLDARVS
ncbi:MAG: alpha/beta hydrolase [Chloroflexi bacterium]|nr:alpha/beta hydrolase [Chloroflexota bacterium]